MSDNITLPRADALQIREALVSGEKLYAALDALDAALELGNARQAIDTHVDSDDVQKLDAIARAVEVEREAICSIVYGLCISDNNAQEIVDAIRARGSK